MRRARLVALFDSLAMSARQRAVDCSSAEA